MEFNLKIVEIILEFFYLEIKFLKLIFPFFQEIFEIKFNKYHFYLLITLNWDPIIRLFKILNLLFKILS
jgi:hypothetical protein